MNSPLLLSCLVSITVTIMLVGLFHSMLQKAEVGFLHWFSGLTQSPRWFSTWALLVFLWIGARALLQLNHVVWFTQDADLIVMTVLWSVVPFMVENAMKYQQARQMDALTELTVAIKDELDRGRTRDEQAAQRDELAAHRDETLISLVETTLDVLDNFTNTKEGHVPHES